MIETDRFRDWHRSPWENDEGAQFEQQCRVTQMELIPGPDRRIK